MLKWLNFSLKTGITPVSLLVETPVPGRLMEENGLKVVNSCSQPFRNREYQEC